jgi:hypothetical protein
MRLLPYVVPIGLAIYALIDLARSQPPERGGLHPAAWVALILFLPVLGPIAWIVLSRYLRSESGGAPARPTGPSRPGPGRGVPRRRGPVAPDDDPDFLWRLERDSRRRRGERPAEDTQGDGVGPASTDPDGGGSGTQRRDADAGESTQRRDAEDGDPPRT